MFTYQTWKQYQQPHPKDIARSFKNSLEERLLRDIHCKQKSWNRKVLCGLIVSTIPQLNLLLVFFSVYQ